MIINPENKFAANKFIAKYEAIANYTDKDYLTYLQLKYLHHGKKWKTLNKIAYYLKDQKCYSLVNLCLMESLRLNRCQPEIFELAQTFVKNTMPRFPEYLHEDQCSVSIIMATNRGSSEIKGSIQSVLDQTFKDFELIIINDGGPETIKNIVDQFASDKIRYIRLEKNVGSAKARNEAICHAKGKYIAYLDDDDVYYPDHLEVLTKALKKEGLRFAYTNSQGVLGELDDGEFKRSKVAFVWDKDFNPDTLVENLYITTCSIMHEKSVFKEVGLFYEDWPHSYDWEFWLRCATKYNFIHISQCTNEYRLKQNNRTVEDRTGAFFFGDLVCKFHAFFKGNISCVKFYLAGNQYNVAKKLYKEIKEEASNYFKTEAITDELINLACYFNDDKFFQQLTFRFSELKKRSTFWQRKFIIFGSKIMNMIGKV